MKGSRLSTSNDCIFVIPASDIVEMLLDYNGLEWSNENISEERLRTFSNKCEGINISFFENDNGKVLMFSQKSEMEDSIELYIESIFADSLPCAFFDKDSKVYDNFSLPATTRHICVSIKPREAIALEWEYEEDTVSAEVDSVDDSVLDPPYTPSPSANSEYESMLSENEDLRKKNQALSDRCQELETEIGRIREESCSEPNPEKDLEINELNRLIRQLADSRFNDYYTETLDSEINALMDSLAKKRNLFAEKKKSQEKLQSELDEIERATEELRSAISELMENIGTAEKIQSEYSTDVSEKKARLEALLADLGMDLDTIIMYPTDKSVEGLLADATEVKDRLEQKLRSLIQERQKECDERTNRIKGSS